jgi:hypothetical protein
MSLPGIQCRFHRKTFGVKARKWVKEEEKNSLEIIFVLLRRFTYIRLSVEESREKKSKVFFLVSLRRFDRKRQLNAAISHEFELCGKSSSLIVFHSLFFLHFGNA